MNRLVIPCLILVLLAAGAKALGLDLLRDGRAVSTIVVPE